VMSRRSEHDHGDELGEFVHIVKLPRNSFLTDRSGAFSVVGPKLWNTLPLTIRSSPSTDIFFCIPHCFYIPITYNNAKKLPDIESSSHPEKRG